MSAIDCKASCVMSRINARGSIAQGGRFYRNKGWVECNTAAVERMLTLYCIVSQHSRSPQEAVHTIHDELTI